MIIANIGALMLKWEHKFAPRKMRYVYYGKKS